MKYLLIVLGVIASAIYIFRKLFIVKIGNLDLYFPRVGKDFYLPRRRKKWY